MMIGIYIVDVGQLLIEKHGVPLAFGGLVSIGSPLEVGLHPLIFAPVL